MRIYYTVLSIMHTVFNLILNYETILIYPLQIVETVYPGEREYMTLRIIGTFSDSYFDLKLWIQLVMFNYDLYSRAILPVLYTFP